ncbi:MAG: hypothetical protein HYY52_01705 [Candidatus Melainabacteria bacterium]|nr:hypothetical protein [Candidatus Melainabacteria bacterium]
MFKRLLFSLFIFMACSIFCSTYTFAQDEGIEVELITGGQANCRFNGKVPFRRIKASNNNIVTDASTGRTEVSINSELDTEKNTINANIFTVVEALSNPATLLSGESVTFESTDFEFSISKERKSDGKIIEVTNETPEGERTQGTVTILVDTFVDNKASGTFQTTFTNTFRTIEKLEEDVETDENGRVIVKCTFKNVPVNFSGAGLPDLPF